MQWLNLIVNSLSPKSQMHRICIAKTVKKSGYRNGSYHIIPHNKCRIYLTKKREHEITHSEHIEILLRSFFGNLYTSLYKSFQPLRRPSPRRGSVLIKLCADDTYRPERSNYDRYRKFSTARKCALFKYPENAIVSNKIRAILRVCLDRFLFFSGFCERFYVFLLLSKVS